MASEAKAASLTASVQVNKGVLFIGDLFTANSMTVLGMIQGRISVTHSEDFSNLTLSDQTGPEVLARLSLGHNLSAQIPVVMPPDGTMIARVSSAGNKGVGYSNPQVPVETGCAIIPLSELGGGLKFDRAWSRLAGNGITAAPTATATVAAAGAAQGAVSIPVSALPSAIPPNTYLIFLPGANKTAFTAAGAAAAATTIPVAALPTALVSGDAAPYQPIAAAIPQLSLFMWRCGLSMGDHTLGVEDGGREIVTVTVQAMHSFAAGVPEGAKLGIYGDPMAFATPVTGFAFGSTVP
jgi:hypothetical protein